MSRSRRNGFTLIELLIVVGVIAVIAAIAIPNLLAARMRGNEASAVGSMRTIVTAQADYNGLNRGYADDLATLATPCVGMTTPFVGADLATNGVEKSGYRFALAAGAGGVAGPIDCNGTATQTAFYVSATPLAVGTTGNRGFAANAANAIWQDTTGAAPVEPFTSAGTVSPLAQ
jgi:prepilin-type N-terminal cleavage/methylation domain-containing protein